MNESAIDSKLIRYAGIKSPNEIARETGLEPEEVARRTEEIFDRVSISPEKMAAKNIFQLQEIVAKQMERVANASNEDVARLGNTAAGAIGRLQLAVEKMLALQNADSTEKDRAASIVFADIAEKSAYRVLGRVEERLKSLESLPLELEPEYIRTELREIMVEVASEYDI